MPKALLDSSTYIDLEKAHKHRRRSWAANTVLRGLAYTAAHGKPLLSVVTVVEILHGLNSDINPVKALTFKQTAQAHFDFLDVTTEIGYLASEIMARLGSGRHSIGLADSLIAATALNHGLVLVTSNTRHFPRVIDLGYPLILENWRDE